MALSASALAVAAAPRALAQAAGEWTLDQAQAILDKTQTLTLGPDLKHLSAGERAAVGFLLQAGQIFQDVYELQRHRDALAVRAALARRTDPRGKAL